MSFRFRVEQLSRQHKRSTFSCGVPALDDYIRTRASQDVKRLVASCFVLSENDTGTVAGYYTLSAASLPLGDLPEALSKKLPHYQMVPAVRVGRLAVAESFQGQGLGEVLLADAARRVLRGDIGVFALLVDAKDENGVGFYERHGFVRIRQTLSLLLPLDTLREGAGRSR